VRALRFIRVAAASGAAVAAAALFTTSDRSRPAPSLHAFRVDAGGLALRAVRSGHGPHVLFLHGYGESLVAWRGVFDAVARHADAIAIDLPGFGLSAKPPSGYATDSLATVVLRTLDALGVAEVVVVGHSLGGAVAVAAAAAAPQRVRGLVLVAPAVIAAAWSQWPRQADSGTVGRLRDAIARYETMRSRFTAPHDPAWLSEDDTALAYDAATDPAYRAALEAVLREFDFASLTPARAAALRMPVLLIWGRYDQVVPFGLASRLRQALPAARLQAIERSWHRPHVERPDAVADTILAFLRGLDAPEVGRTH